MANTFNLVMSPPPQIPLTILTIFTYLIHASHTHTVHVHPQIPLLMLTIFCHLRYVDHIHTTNLHVNILLQFLHFLRSSIRSSNTHRHTDTPQLTWNYSYNFYNLTHCIHVPDTRNAPPEPEIPVTGLKIWPTLYT